MTSLNSAKTVVKQRTERASKAALAGLLNLTVLPIIGFIWLLLISKQTDKSEIDGYHLRLALKINIYAAIALLLVSSLIIGLGGLDSVYTWIYVITYFTLVHTGFIVTATWAMVCAWSGKKLSTR